MALVLFCCACSEFNSLAEDVELAAQMNELGLPFSFQTNKEVTLFY